MSSQCETTARKAAGAEMPFFERYLSLWVALCIVFGIILGRLVPGMFEALGSMEVAQVNLPVAVLIWLMILPMLLTPIVVGLMWRAMLNPDWGMEQASKNILHLAILRLAASLGVEFAFPSSTLMIEQLPGQDSLATSYSLSKEELEKRADEILERFKKTEHLIDPDRSRFPGV